MAFTYTNSKGQTYSLRTKSVTLRNGRQQQIFFFARPPEAAGKEESGEPVDQVPAGFQVAENPRTGLPFLKKAS